MGLEHLFPALAMVLIGLAFRPLGWLSGLGALVLIVIAFKTLSVIWPFLLGGVLLVIVTLFAVAAIDKRATPNNDSRPKRKNPFDWDEPPNDTD